MAIKVSRSFLSSCQRLYPNILQIYSLPLQCCTHPHHCDQNPRHKVHRGGMKSSWLMVSELLSSHYGEQRKDYGKKPGQTPCPSRASSSPFQPSNNAVIFTVIKKLSNSRLDQRPVNTFNCGHTTTQPLLCPTVPFPISCSLSGNTLQWASSVPLHSQHNQTGDPGHVPTPVTPLSPFYLPCSHFHKEAVTKGNLGKPVGDWPGRLALKHQSLACCQKLSFLMGVFCQDQCQGGYYHSNLRVNEQQLHTPVSLTTDACCYLYAAAGSAR